MMIKLLLLFLFTSSAYSHGVRQHDFSPTPRDFAVSFINGIYAVKSDTIVFKAVPGKSLRFIKLVLKCSKSSFDEAHKILSDAKAELVKLDDRYKLKNYLLIEEDLNCSKT